MNTIRLQLRFLLPLTAALLLAAFLSQPLIDRLALGWFSRDLTLRASLVADALSESIERALVDTPRGAEPLSALFERTVRDERLVALALCTPAGQVLRASSAYPRELTCASARALSRSDAPRWRLESGMVHVGWRPVGASQGDGESESPALVLLHDLSFVERRSRDTQFLLVAVIAALGLVIALITMVVAQVTWRGWVQGARALLRGEGLPRPIGDTSWAAPELAPLAGELRARLRDLEDEYRRSLVTQDAPWTPERLRSLLQQQLHGEDVIVVSNREPYLHERSARGLEVRRPASGLVTALEPVMRACSGTWVAHGSGSGDRDAVDRHDRVRVPPEDPRYTLRRVWLSEAEEQGYYYGFANEGMWPLCHVAHVRPVFRESDWRAYRHVNERFADAVASEARGDDPVVLVQDYHFALLPALLRERLPRATIITFWHIPWPNPESFGICPWRREILQGLLGSSILGFHTRFHCKNFIETVDRFLEARIEHEHSSVSYGGTETLIQTYPISIAWPSGEEIAGWGPVVNCRQHVRTRLGASSDLMLVVGVDRFDYTKGIVERIHALERLLEKHPEWVGRVSLLQVAAPTRSQLEEYRGFRERITHLVRHVNDRFGRPGYQPVHLLAEHHESAAVNEIYRAADVCVVTSLHDGMNLVSKEFVAARDDERGVLILSRFAGAARELNQALIVNPYHVEETADALHRALCMPAAEQRERMASLRAAVRENNVYRWAARMLSDAAHWRLRERIEARVERHRQEVA